MRVLSLDLDFFLSSVKLGAGTGRLPDEGYEPWSEEALREFLERRLLLRRDKPTPSHCAPRHDEAFRVWGKLRRERGNPPLHVTHVDAHADLGMGDDAHVEIMGRLLHLPPEERPKAITRLAEGNFLAYAVACRWIASITYVTHPTWNGRDLHFMHFRDFEERTGWLEMKRVDPQLLERELARYNCYVRPFEAEPAVPFNHLPGASYQATAEFDHVFFCQSPEYTPASADRLIPIVREYLQLG